MTGEEFERMFVNGLELISMDEVKISQDDHTITFRMCKCKVCSLRYAVKMTPEESIKADRKICDLCFEKAQEEYRALRWVDFSFEEYLNTKIMTNTLDGGNCDESKSEVTGNKMSFMWI